MPDGELERRISELEAERAIADLIHEYARLVRRDMPDRVSALFTADGTFEIRDGHPDREEFAVREKLESPQALHAYLAPGKGKPHPVPIIHNVMVEVDGESATANALMEAQVYGTQHKVSGEYRDTFRREGGRWLFASRIFTIYGAGSSV